MKKILLILISFLALISCGKQKEISKPIVFVSILPQKYFVEQLTDKVHVEVMVRPGHSPATYEPTPNQMKLLSKSKLFFTIGVPFEKNWIPKIQNLNKNLKIIATDNSIEKREMEDFAELFEAEHDDHHHGEKHEGHVHKEHDGEHRPKDELHKEHSGHHMEHEKSHDHHGHSHDGGKDPHIWLDPELVKIQSEIISKELDSMLNLNISDSLRNWKQKLSELDKELNEKISYNKKFLVFHPSWGYFADRYNLKMIPIEIEGKSPTPKQLKKIIDYAKSENIKTIFVQKQFQSLEAKAIAEEINGNVIEIDPLAYDYLNNLKQIATKLGNK